jgi:hypothetical protein
MVCATGRGDGCDSGELGGGALSAAGTADGAGRTDLRAGVEVTNGGVTLPSTTIDAPQRLQ